MIELRGISRIYKPKKSEHVHALNKINLSFGEKGMVFVLGKSGSGKSTLLNVIGGLDKYNEGELLIKGKSTKQFKQSDFDSYRNTMIGFIFQDYNVLDEFTVAQNIGLALELQGKKANSESINKILKEVDLEDFGKRKPNQLSGGQKQRVAIARALVKDPEIIMADEPTGALDSNTGRQVFETLKKLSENRLVIVVSHDRDFAETYGSRIIEFKDGSIISDVSITQNSVEDETKIDYKEDRIFVEQGYVLTSRDIEVINEYLKTQKGDTSIERKISGQTFDDTDVGSIKLSDSGYTPIKSKLPFKSSLKIGAGALKHKTVRLVLAIILAAVSFALFGLTDTMSSYDRYSTTVDSVLDSNLNFAALSKTKVTREENYTNYETLKFTNDDLVILNHEFSNLNFKPIYNESEYSDLYFQNSLFKNIPSEKQNIHRPVFSGYFELTNSDISAYDMTLTGRLPLTDSEIVISKYNFDMFKEYNYKNDLGNEEIINNVQDLLGKEISVGYYNKVTIVGVVDTKFDLSRYMMLTEPSDNYLKIMLMMDELETVKNNSIHNVVFVRDGYFSRNIKDNGFSLRESYKLGYYLNFVVGEYDYQSDYVNKVGKADLTDVVFIGGKSKATMTKYDIIASARLLNNIMNNDYDNHMAFMESYARAFVETLTTAQIESLTQIYDPGFSGYDLLDETAKASVKENIYYQFYQHREQYGGGDAKSSYDLYDEAQLSYIESLGSYKIEMKKTTYGNISTDELQRLNIVGFIDEDPYDYSNPEIIILSDEYYDEFGFVDQGDYVAVVTPIDPTDKASIKKLVDYHYKTNGITYLYKNPVTGILGQVNGFLESLTDVFLYIGIAFAVFSSLLLLNFISTSVSYKKKEIGILRAIGARGKDVLGIFTKESTIIALINFTLALAGVIAATIIINGKIRNDYDILITLLKPGIRQIVLMLGVTLTVGFISSALPVTRIARKRPIDAIRDN